MAELRQELLASSGKKDKQHLNKRIALKRIVANMTMSNNDMIALFPDVINCMTIASLEIKKMYVYALLRNISSSPSPGASCISSIMRARNRILRSLHCRSWSRYCFSFFKRLVG